MFLVEEVLVFCTLYKNQTCFSFVPIVKPPLKKPGDGRKVTFFEPGSVEEGGLGKCRRIKCRDVL